jgi:hypothetical protein
MKNLSFKPNILSGLGIVTAMMLTSCVDPNFALNSSPPSNVTTYSTGYEVHTLPNGYRTEIIDGTRYYNYNGVYYRSRSGRYVVVDSPRSHRHNDHYSQDRGGVVIRNLPSGYRVVRHNGVRYYKVRDTYYQQRGAGYVQVHLSL